MELSVFCRGGGFLPRPYGDRWIERAEFAQRFYCSTLLLAMLIYIIFNPAL